MQPVSMLMRRISWPIVSRSIDLRATFVLMCSVAAATSVSPSVSVAASVPAFGEAGRFGGLDTAANFEGPTTSGLNGVGSPAKIVYPIGMVVDSKASGAPDEYAIYVLENVNPQALNEELESKRTTKMTLEYRIQKISDTGEVLAETQFSLKSSTTESNLHAVAIAVDPRDARVYVLIADAPSSGAGNTNAIDAADRIDAWTSTLDPVGAGELSQDAEVGTGEIVGPTASHQLQASGFVGDLYAPSITVDDEGTKTRLALAGNRFTTVAGKSEPVVEAISTESGHVGELTGEWNDAEATENAAALALGVASSKLYSLSTNPSGSLNATLGPEEKRKLHADDEPNMATISASLAETTPVLPWENAVEDELPHNTDGGKNIDRSATEGFLPYLSSTSRGFQAFGGTPNAGVLAPSVVQLAGSGSESDSGNYAGLVAVDNLSSDEQNPLAETGYTWVFADATEDEGENVIAKPANLGIRIFNGAGESLGMVGDVTPGGVCNIESSPVGVDASYSGASFVALAAGRDGVFFALVQPSLINSNQALAGTTELIAPASAIGATMGDEIIEFAPKGSSGMGANSAIWRECPQPEGQFTVTNQSQGGSQVGGATGVTVAVDTKLRFDADGINDRGGAVWGYDWDLENGAASGEVNHPWTVNNEFTETPEQGAAWEWPSASVEHEYTTPGSYDVKLDLVSDFGTLTDEREVNVVPDEPITGVGVSASTGTKAGGIEALVAAAMLPRFDSIADYHWEFGDGQGEDTTGPEAQHIYSEAGQYTVKLTVTDALGQAASAEEIVSIAAASELKTERKAEPEPTKTTTPTTTTPTVTTPSVKPPLSTAKPLTRAQELEKALKACKKIKAKKKRASCETAAKRKYAPHKKKTKKKGH